MNPFVLMRTIASLLRRFVPPLIVSVVRLPVLLISALAAAVGTLRRLSASPGRLIAASADSVRCRRCGLHQSLLGRWRCPCCRAFETTHAWAPCRICGVEVPAGYIRCEGADCGEAIVHPRLQGLS